MYNTSWSKLTFLLIAGIIVSGKSQEIKREGRDFHGYLSPEDDKKFDYHIYQNPLNNFGGYNEDYSECAKNPMLPLLGKGLNLLLLKLGIFGVVKAVSALILGGLLFKLPLLLLKVAFLKTIFFPLIAAPLFLHMFSSHMSQSNDQSSEEKPAEIPADVTNMLDMTDMTMNMGRELDNNMTSMAWQSMKMFVESDQCLEKITCMIGASSKDSSIGSIFTRALKYIQYSSPPILQKRMASVKEAFSKGSKTSTCLSEEFKCQSPELLLQYGIKKIKIL